MSSAETLTAAVFASGSGSNFQALVESERTPGAGSGWVTRLLVSDREGAGALDRARSLGVESRVLPVAGRSPEAVAAETLATLEDAGVDVVFLAGYLRLVPAAVVQRFRNRILNIHPALLPSFGGKGMWGRHVHQAVLAAGCRVTGPTVHVVDEVYDRGMILAQWPVPVRSGDTAELLASRVLAAEHRLYPRVARHLCRTLRSGGSLTPLDDPGTRFILD
jgi:formyltetrahydrofolate-dependent phosphoribosylglycinamide formyltransferase